MTIEELRQIMHQLHLDYDAEPSLVYVFYQTPDGLINNFSINIHHARQRNGQPMDAAQLAELMEREYPATRQGRLMAVEHPRQGLSQWLDSSEVCQLLHTTTRSLYRWTADGRLHPARIGRRLFYDAAEDERFNRSNIVQDNGRIDRSGS